MERLQSHIDECKKRVDTINEFVSNNSYADKDECEKNSSVLMNVINALEEYREYKDLEEQGKLLKLPCAVGDMIYHICTFSDGKSEIIEMKVGCVEPCGAIRNHKRTCEVWNMYAETDYTKAYFKFFDFGKTVFLTREEAEVALKELEEIKRTDRALTEAADTIESLSAKLADMERSAEDCGGGWIYCGDGKNLPEKCNSYLVTKHIEETEDNTEQFDVCTEIFWTKDNKWDCERDPYCEWKVTAWQPRPEPYHEP